MFLFSLDLAVSRSSYFSETVAVCFGLQICWWVFVRGTKNVKIRCAHTSVSIYVDFKV